MRWHGLLELVLLGFVLMRHAEYLRRQIGVVAGEYCSTANGFEVLHMWSTHCRHGSPRSKRPRPHRHRYRSAQPHCRAHLAQLLSTANARRPPREMKTSRAGGGVGNGGGRARRMLGAMASTKPRLRLSRAAGTQTSNGGGNGGGDGGEHWRCVPARRADSRRVQGRYTDGTKLLTLPRRPSRARTRPPACAPCPRGGLRTARGEQNARAARGSSSLGDAQRVLAPFHGEIPARTLRASHGGRVLSARRAPNYVGNGRGCTPSIGEVQRHAWLAVVPDVPLSCGTIPSRQ